MVQCEVMCTTWRCKKSQRGFVCRALMQAEFHYRNFLNEIISVVLVTSMRVGVNHSFSPIG